MKEKPTAINPIMDTRSFQTGVSLVLKRHRRADGAQSTWGSTSRPPTSKWTKDELGRNRERKSSVSTTKWKVVA